MLKIIVSNIQVKKINRNRIFRYVNNKEHASKPEIAATLGLSIPTVLHVVNELKDEGLILEVGEYASTGGRKATAIATIKDSHSALGLDITLNHVGFALTNLSGSIIKHKRIHFPYKNEDAYYRTLAECAEQFLSENAIENSLFLGIGISLPGIVDMDLNKLTYSHTLSVSNLDLSEFTSNMFCDCIFVNDANAAAIAELYHISDRKDTVYVSLSNIVGGAFIKAQQEDFSSNIIEEKLFNGNNGRAGEFGHMTLVPNGRQCYCGKIGCVDSYCNAKLLSEHSDNKLELFFERLEEDREHEDVWNEYLDYLAIAVNNLRMVFDCQIIIGGYVGSHIEQHINRLMERVEGRNTFDADGSYIMPCRYKVEASALGAALLQLEGFISKI